MLEEINMEASELRKKKFSQVDFSEHTHTVEIFKSENGKTIQIDHLRKGNSEMEYVRFVNDDYGLSVYGDFGNWIFCRPFFPSEKGYASFQYWNEKLKNSSVQNHGKYCPEETQKEIEELIDNRLEDIGYEGEDLKKAKEYLNGILYFVDDETEYKYNAFHYQTPPLDYDEIPFCKTPSIRFEIILDAYNEMCNRLSQ